MFGWKLVHQSKLDEIDAASYNKIVNNLQLTLYGMSKICDKTVEMISHHHVDDDDPKAACELGSRINDETMELDKYMTSLISLLRLFCENRFSSPSFKPTNIETIRGLHEEVQSAIHVLLEYTKCSVRFLTDLSNDEVDDESIPKVRSMLERGQMTCVIAIGTSNANVQKLIRALDYEFKAYETGVDVIQAHYAREKDIKRETLYRFRFTKPVYVHKLNKKERKTNG